MARSKQLELKVSRGWGGARKGAGRKRKRPETRRNVPHVTRPPHKSRHPTLVTMRARFGGLRQERVYQALKTALWRQSRRRYSVKFQVAHFSIQNDHIHLIVEGQDPGAIDERDVLRRALIGLASSLARLINKMLERSGSVWADRHHRRDLASPTEVRNALVYVLNNWKRHGHVVFGAGAVDPFSSGPRFTGWIESDLSSESDGSGGRCVDLWPAASPRTWLLRVGWQRARPLGPLSTVDGPASAASAALAPIVRAYIEPTAARARSAPGASGA